MFVRMRFLSAVAAAGFGWCILPSCAGDVSTSATLPKGVPLFAVADSVILPAPSATGRNVELIGAFALSDSVITVVSNDAGGVVLVRADGTFLPAPRNLGAARPAYVAPCTQGGLVIITSGQRRALPLGEDGVLAGSWELPASVGTILGAQCESVRDLVALVEGTLPEIDGAALVRVGAALVHIADGGRRVDTVSTFPGRELLRFSPSDPGVVPPFGITIRFAAGPTRLYLATSNEATIDELQTNGRQLGTIDVVADARRVTRAEIDSALHARFARRLSQLPDDVVQEMIAALARDRSLPLWTALAVDPDENVWVAANEPPDPDGDRAWVVYSTGGSRRAKVFLPHDFEVTEVGRDYVLGFYRSLPAARAARRFGLQLLGG